MKKMALILIMASLFTGCGTMAEKSEFWSHDTVYKNLDHMVYSIYGYKDSSKETLEKTRGQNWWGLPQPYTVTDESAYHAQK